MWEIEYYCKENGEVPVAEFIDSLSVKMRARADWELQVLSRLGTAIREPYSKPIAKGLFELRIQSEYDIARVFFFFVIGRRIILTNGFIKKTRKTPRSEIETAKIYKADYLERFEKVQ